MPPSIGAGAGTGAGAGALLHAARERMPVAVARIASALITFMRLLRLVDVFGCGRPERSLGLIVMLRREMQSICSSPSWASPSQAKKAQKSAFIC